MSTEGPNTIIEIAKTGRARCRTCRAAIAKGELRFGEETPSAFSDSGGVTWSWHHLACAAKKKAPLVKPALARFEGEVPERVALEALLAEADKQAADKPAAFPYAERAPTGRSRCLHCEAPIEKGHLRVAVEREIEAAGMNRTGAGYLHAGCALEYTGDDDLLDKLRTNSKLPAPDLDELAEQLDS